MITRLIPPALLVLAACTPAIAQQQDGSRMIEQLEKADANRDGAVSRSEFTIYRTSQFQRLDRNKDGYITESDIPGPVQKRLPPEMTFARIKTTFDTNGDSKVSQVEFVNGPTLAFDRIDANKDNVVTNEELDAARAMFASAR